MTFAGDIINNLVRRPGPVPLSLESGEARPKLPLPGSPLPLAAGTERQYG